MKRLMCLVMIVLLLFTSVPCMAYFKLVKLYAEDGREIQVVETDENHSVVKKWLAVGWYEGVYVYAPNGRKIEVSPFAVQQWVDVGWYTYPVRAMYASDGRQILINASEIEAYEAVGWHTSPNVTLYATDGRKISVPLAEKEAYMNVGWYDSAVIEMYAADGRTISAPLAEKEAYINVGWYEFPVVKMYSADGRTIVVSKNEVTAYEAVGWYRFPVVRLYAKDDRTIVVSKSEASAYEAVGWYTSQEKAQNVGGILPGDEYFEGIVFKEGMYDTVKKTRHYSPLGFSLEYPEKFTRYYSDDAIVIRWYDSFLEIKKYTNRSMKSVRAEVLEFWPGMTERTVYVSGKSASHLQETNLKLFTHREFYFIERNGAIYVASIVTSFEGIEGVCVDFHDAIYSMNFY